MMPHISGTTRLYGLVGDPLTTAKSPELLNRLFMEQGADAVCVPFGVKGDDLSAFVTGARAVGNLSGLLVTMPHKQRMLDYVDELHPTALKLAPSTSSAATVMDAGSVQRSTVLAAFSVWSGKAFIQRTNPCCSSAPEAQAEPLRSRSRAAGARALTIFDVDRVRAEDLARSVTVATDCHTQFGAPDPHGFEVVINATALGMKPGDPLPVDPARLEPGSIVVDIINSVEPTSLCRAASERGCRTQSGRPMHEGQAVHALRFLGFDYVPRR
ncbi:shikimate dehydrogenase [Polaromonas sp. P2-4]|nr:shikimate dehydrogenase [Polaromonas sp. P2-4]